MNTNLCGAIGLSLALAGLASAQGTNFRLRQIATSTSSLTVVASAPGDGPRLFVGQTNGVIRILNLSTGVFLATPFVTLPGGTTTNGLLNLTFDPRWAQNGFFYASKQDSGGFVTIYRGRISAADPNIADPASITKVFSRYSTGGQHTGGLLAFGDDGFLYVTSGDQSGDPQSLTTWGGKIFRIDVDGPDNTPGNEDDDGFINDVNNNYTIPASNPYVGVPNTYTEIWARGLRNPYRVSRDPQTGIFWIADVGGGFVEEVSLMPPGVPAMNFGWPILEGTRCNSSASNCSAMISTPPLVEYQHTGSGLLTGFAIIGGVVYHGNAMPWLEGTYFFADNGNSWIATMREKNGQRIGLTNRKAQMNPGSVTGFSCFTSAPNGEIYACTYSPARVFAVEPTLPRDCNNNGIDDGIEGLPVCIADFDANCGVDINDLLDFLTAFEQGNLSADYDDGTGDGLVDGSVTIEDLLMYLGRFEAGC